MSTTSTIEATTTAAAENATATAANGADTAAKTGGWATQTFGEKIFSVTVFGLATLASAAMAYYLFTDPSKLSELYAWIRSLPILVQLVIWLLCLPWMIALWIWSMPWAFALKFVLVLGILVFTEYLMWPVK